MKDLTKLLTQNLVFGGILFLGLLVSGCQTDGISTRLTDVSEYFVSSEGYISEMVESSLVEDGLPVRLHFIIHKPKGDGPFPLLVFNHGSTGRGTDPSKFRRINFYRPIASHFVRKGWMVAIPHRRGRGWSDGLYDEGFANNRSLGYTCKATRSLRGAERAREDLAAAMEILAGRPDVDPSRIVIGGQSRGGILSIAFAGLHPGQFKGVIDFVGGWMGDGCSTAREINGNLARMGGNFPHPTLWLYAGNDSYYSIGHTKAFYQTFVSAGGHGEFVIFDQASHDFMWNTNKWRDSIDRYMTSLGFQEFAE